MADDRKNAYLRDLIRVMQEMDTLFDNAPDIENEYFDLGYNSGGAREVIDADVIQWGLTAANIGSAITLIQQVKNLAGNAAVTTGDYALTTNIFKRAPV